MARRLKVGQRVWVRHRCLHPSIGREWWWERGRVEIVRRAEVVVRVEIGRFERTVPLEDVFEERPR